MAPEEGIPLVTCSGQSLLELLEARLCIVCLGEPPPAHEIAGFEEVWKSLLGGKRNQRLCSFYRLTSIAAELRKDAAVKQGVPAVWNSLDGLATACAGIARWPVTITEAAMPNGSETDARDRKLIRFRNFEQHVLVNSPFKEMRSDIVPEPVFGLSRVAMVPQSAHHGAHGVSRQEGP
jgi:hypothetical protein